MTKLEIFDPPMCCTSGICGSSADPILVVFASDLEWLKEQGVEIVRYGFSLTPDEFKNNQMVNDLMEQKGESCLPVVTLDGKIIYKGSYPSRLELARMCNVEYNEDEAPPIHREENCCCGVDCDCRMPQAQNKMDTSKLYNCENAAAEDNCMLGISSETPQSKSKINISKTAIFFIIIAVLLIILFKIIF